MQTSVYIDGFNLYYGCLRSSETKAFKWLDVNVFVKSILGVTSNITAIKYFTARVKNRPNDPNQNVRQSAYLRALRTIPNLTIIEGHFLTSEIYMPEASNPRNKVKVIKTEEKGSDVNLAVHLVADGFKGLYDHAVVVSNDSDLVEAVHIVRRDLGKQVTVIHPLVQDTPSGRSKKPSYELGTAASHKRFVRKSNLSKSQFPPTLVDSIGTIHKPTTW